MEDDHSHAGDPAFSTDDPNPMGDNNDPNYIRNKRKSATPSTLNRLKRGNITKDTKKRIMILCPICKGTHILKGRERYLYIREAIERKSLKYGKTCSPECQKLMMNPITRKKAHKVSHLYRELPRDSRMGRPPGSKNLPKKDEEYSTVAKKKLAKARKD